jgi:hypothetical protein
MTPNMRKLRTIIKLLGQKHLMFCRNAFYQRNSSVTLREVLLLLRNIVLLLQCNVRTISQENTNIG